MNIRNFGTWIAQRLGVRAHKREQPADRANECDRNEAPQQGDDARPIDLGGVRFVFAPRED